MARSREDQQIERLARRAVMPFAGEVSEDEILDLFQEAALAIWREMERSGDEARCVVAGRQAVWLSRRSRYRNFSVHGLLRAGGTRALVEPADDGQSVERKVLLLECIRKIESLPAWMRDGVTATLRGGACGKHREAARCAYIAIGARVDPALRPG